MWPLTNKTLNARSRRENMFFDVEECGAMFDDKVSPNILCRNLMVPWER